MEDYNKLIQQRVDKGFNKILIISSIVAFIASVILYTADLPKGYALLNLCAGIIALLFFVFANKIETSYKIIFIIIMTSIVGVASFIGGSFYSAFSILFVLSNILAVLFLQHRTSIIISFSSIGLLLLLCYYTLFIKETSDIVDPLLTWGLLIIAYILLLVVLHISVYVMKKFLMENIDKLKLAVDRSNELAYYDQLTLLPNAIKFKLDVSEQINAHQKNGFIVFLNLKSLSVINSTLGNNIGDQAIVQASLIIQKLQLAHSIIARTGGNEFAVWIDDISENNLCAHFDAVMSELKAQSIILKKKLEFYASYACFTYNENTLDECYQQATLTLTYAKNNNMTNLVSYNDTLEKDLRRKEKIKDLIESALDQEEFTLFYQAKVDSRTNKTVGVEALARWHNKELGLISPDEFIPIIESLNMSIEFGNFVIGRACRDYSALQKKYTNDVAVSINISPTHLLNESITTVISHTLLKHQVPGNKLTIEITEDIIIQNLQVVKSRIKELRSLKVKIALCQDR